MIARGLRRLAVAGLVVLAATVAAVLWFSARNLGAWDAARGLEAPIDAIIVLGGGVDPDGVLAYSSRRRVAAAARLQKAGQARHLILAGGVAPGDPGPPAAQLMRDHARALGVPDPALILEERSVSTFENLRFALEIARARGFERLALLTDAFHLERARRLAAWLGAPAVRPVAVDGLRFEDPGGRVWSILREALAWWFNLGKVAAWEALALAGIEEGARGALVR